MRYYVGSPIDTIKDNLSKTSPSKPDAFTAAIYSKESAQYVLFTYTIKGELVIAQDITNEFTSWRDKFVNEMQKMMNKMHELELKKMKEVFYGDNIDNPTSGLASLIKLKGDWSAGWRSFPALERQLKDKLLK